MSLVFEKGTEGRADFTLPQTAIDEYSIASIPDKLLRKEELTLPELSERETVLHYKSLICGDNGENSSAYILSSVDDAARIDGFTGVHPYQLGDACQGALELLFNVEHMISDILGVDAVSVRANTKTESYISCLSIAKARTDKNKVILCGSFEDEVKELFSLSGITTVNVQSKDVSGAIDNDTLAVIITTDDFSDIKAISEKAKAKGSLLVLDMEECRDIIGIARPGDMGFDMVLADVSKLFDVASVPGDAKCRIMGVTSELSDLIPLPTMDIDELEQYYFQYKRTGQTGNVTRYYGNFTALIKTLAFILSSSYDGLKEISENIRLNKAYKKK